MRLTPVDKVVRIVAGLVFATSGVLRAFALGSSAYTQTLVWSMSGGNPSIVLLLACVEVALGVAVCVGLWPRLSAAGVLALLVLFSAILVYDAASDTVEGRPCGCLGTAAIGSGASPGYAMPVLRNAVIAAAVLLATPWRRNAGLLRAETPVGPDPIGATGDPRPRSG